MGINIGQGDAENPDKGYQMFITSTVMIIVAGFTVLGRLAARLSNKGFGWDDLSIVIALVASIALSVTVNLAIVNGYGRKKKSLEKTELTSALMYFYIAQVIYKIVIGFTKASIILLYLRIFVNKSFRRACYVALFIVGGFTIGATVATGLQCIPTAGAWDKSVDAKCTNSIAFWYSWCIINIMTDVLILALPIREILGLQLPRREKYGLLGVFSLGLFVIVSSIIRATAVANSTKNQNDITWNFIPRGIWTLVEANTGIICASLPMLYKPASTIFPWLRHSTTSRSGGKYSGKYPVGSSSKVSTDLNRANSQRKATGWTMPHGSELPPDTGAGASDIEITPPEWGEHDDEYPLGREPLPLTPMKPTDDQNSIVRKVDVDVTYEDNMYHAVSDNARMHVAKETV